MENLAEMIKGISKQIIEIKCPNSEYFEKVLLFVNSKSNVYSSEILNAQAKLFSQQLCGEMKEVKKDNKNLFGSGWDNAGAKVACIVVLSAFAAVMIAVGLLL